MSAPRKHRVEVNGWIVLDKPVGMTSTNAVSAARRLLKAKKAGHAGTLDPLASGILPLAFGEATKTVPYVVDGEKAYDFTIRWGVQTDTDDSQGRPIAASDSRPAAAEVEAALARFVGRIEQTPPRFSAIKIEGERAYDLARDGEEVALRPRPVEIHTLRMTGFDAAEGRFAAECGKGVYVRAIARDLGAALGCLGHVTALRRTRVGPFFERDATPLAALEADPAALARALRPVEAGLSELACIPVSREAAIRLRRGQSVILRGRDAPVEGGPVYVSTSGVPIAVGTVDKGEFVPLRVFNLPF